MSEPQSLASQRGLSKSSAGRLPLPFPVGQPGRVYFALFANNICRPHAHTAAAHLSKHCFTSGDRRTLHPSAALFCTVAGISYPYSVGQPVLYDVSISSVMLCFIIISFPNPNAPVYFQTPPITLCWVYTSNSSNTL